MPTITVKLDKKRADRLSRWSRTRKSTKSEIIREMIDREGPIVTADDLIEVFKTSAGKGLGLARKKA
jgi:predicted nuclease of restriction endonuclease-like RecB superfamily